MNGPAKNRLHDYEAGWLSMLVKTGLATRKEAEEAQGRVMQETIDEMHKKKERRRSRGRKRKPEQE
jgi:capsid protein